MTKIKITGGRYGYISPAGVYSVKSSDDPPFEVENGEAARLVKRGVAEIDGEGGKRPETGDISNGEGSNPTEGENPAEGEFVGFFGYDESTSVKELREIGKKCGLSFPVGVTKADMIATLDEYFGRDTEDDESDIDLSAEPPVV